MSYKLSAFSLIEMAIVLIIIGLISGFTLPMLKGVMDSQKTKTTAMNQETVLYAIASYANQYKILPYAADPITANGREDKVTRRRRGIVPFADLGLPESAAKDGYQRWFTYVVDDYYAVIPEMGIAGSLSKPIINRLCENRRHPNTLQVKGLQENVALALISHGPNGRGAYPNPLNSPPQGADEHQNATSDQEIIDRPISFDPTHPFSHKIVWVTSRNLLAIYGHAPCPPPQELIPQPGEMRYQQPRFLEKK